MTVLKQFLGTDLSLDLQNSMRTLFMARKSIKNGNKGQQL